MSYNTRRSGTGPGQQGPPQSQQQIGQRRPVVTNNFVSGGQLQSQGQQPQQQKPQAQYHSQQSAGGQQQRPQQQAAGGQQQSQIQFRNQQQARPQQQGYSTQPQQQQQGYQQQQKPAQPQQQKPPMPAQTPSSAPVVPGANPPPPDSVDNDAMDTSADGERPKKKFWFRGKVDKKEKQRKRNLRLSKILQPKNAVMVLNELIKGAVYTVEELPCKVDNNQFKAIVQLEGEEHVGLGRSKNQAKNSAAENALKYLMKNKQLKLKTEPDQNGQQNEGEEQMEITEEGSNTLPWQHVASFALYKLFSSWGEDPSETYQKQAAEYLGSIVAAGGKVPTPGEKVDTRPAKKMPDNPETVNPLMLLHQMRPGSQFEEVGKSGTPPDVTFTYRVTVDGKAFNGTGKNKKAAKKLAAFSACHSVLGVNYPADVWVPLY